jgi:hypothetical protein
MFTEISASAYDYKNIFRNREFEYVMSKIIDCYRLMIGDAVPVANDENKIRDELYLNYLNNDAIRKSIDLQRYFFDRETIEDRTSGRTDIRVLTHHSFLETSAFYVIECKRINAKNLNGMTGLNAEYISEGICRFVEEKYSAHFKTNGMIGFVVQSMDIKKNVDSINRLLSTTFKQANTTQVLEFHEIVENFKFSYCSTHDQDKKSITLYHLMLDFSSNIE